MEQICEAKVKGLLGPKKTENEIKEIEKTFKTFKENS